MVNINIKGVSYPYYETMGAMLDFKTQTGIDVADVKPKDTELQLKYMWLTVNAAAKRSGVAAPQCTFEEFTCDLTGVEYLRVQKENAEAVAKVLNEQGADSKNE